ncbi:hypothetical protein [Corynebacterium flavescens]|uniref:hypothetical protein n=1 Tax=Corynebacterium flavescens TaxID=28028 RepID=UPI0028969220|nr:hypothetical protein [Corynebacterium flavescens]
MNPTVVSASLAAASKAWSKFQDYREQKALESYALLEEATAKASQATNGKSDEILSEARKQAGHVTQAAHLRLERALEELKNRSEEAGERLVEVRKNFSERAEDAEHSTRKASRQALKKAQKASKEADKSAKRTAKKVNKKLTKKTGKLTGKLNKKNKRGKAWPVAAILALLSVLGAAFYFLRLRKEPASEVPPRVEEFAGGADRAAAGSTLVYSSVSGEDDKEAVQPQSDLAEESVVERDEELLGSIDEQLAQLRSDAEDEDAADSEDAKDAQDAGDTDESTDKGK